LTSKIIFGILVSEGDENEKNQKSISTSEGSQRGQGSIQVGWIHQGLQPDAPEPRD
jgi:hypothetical protein